MSSASSTAFVIPSQARALCAYPQEVLAAPIPSPFRNPPAAGPDTGCAAVESMKNLVHGTEYVGTSLDRGPRGERSPKFHPHGIPPAGHTTFSHWQI